MLTIHSYRVPCSGVKAFIEDSQGRLLILRHAKHELTKKPSWGLPGGHINWGEDPEESLKREVKEELGVAIIAREPILAWNKRISEKHQIINIGFRCDLANKTFDFKLSQDDDAYHWLKLAEIDQYFPKTDLEYRPVIVRYFRLSH